MGFDKEKDFESALIAVLQTKGWETEVIKNPSEKDLIENWKNILFNNNRERDRLNDFPLTDTEMQQILDQIRELKTPLKLNGFINVKLSVLNVIIQTILNILAKKLALIFTIEMKLRPEKANTKLPNSHDLRQKILLVIADAAI